MIKICKICKNEFLPTNNRQKVCLNFKCKKKLKLIIGFNYRKKYQEKLRQKNKEYRTRTEIKDRLIKYRKEHKEERIKYNQNHKEAIKNQQKKYYKNHKNEINQYRQDKFNKDISFKLKCYLRTRLYLALKGIWKSKHTLDLLGCSIEFLKQHLQKQFKKGMNWDNYGLWHIDHIRPCASFDFSKPEEQARCFNYTNLRPLWAKENLEKSDKII